MTIHLKKIVTKNNPILRLSMILSEKKKKLEIVKKKKKGKKKSKYQKLKI